MMIIDCHGHYTTSPPQLQAFRDEQLGLFAEGKDTSLAKMAAISDGEIIDSIENNQLKLIKQRGGDLTIFSPKASAMGQHQADLKTSIAWAQESNNLIYRVCELFPENFAPGCQLPQEDGQMIQPAIDELRRCVEMGFVGFNLNPDPSGGHWTGKPLTDPYWYPLYEVMMELDVPAMIHVSGSCNECHHTTGAHYINGDTSAFMQLVQGDLFARFPSLRMIIPHDGGAVPYHWGRYRGLAQMLGKPEPAEHIMKNVFFDTCVYHKPGVELLLSVIGVDNVLFGSEMLGAVKGIDPNTGDYFDDTKKYVDQLDLTDNDRYKLFESNARRVFPRLDQRLTTLGL
jgi:4-oxalmesaconate hydratase